LWQVVDLSEGPGIDVTRNTVAAAANFITLGGTQNEITTQR